jgi:hypothetical protein
MDVPVWRCKYPGQDASKSQAISGRDAPGFAWRAFFPSDFSILVTFFSIFKSWSGRQILLLNITFNCCPSAFMTRFSAVINALEN